MLEVHQRHLGSEPPAARLTLPWDARTKSRLRATLEDGREIGLFLPRGTVLEHGARLQADDGTVIEVVAEPESLSRVRSEDHPLLLRAAYHLGNRHVPVEIGEGWLSYGHDHVLDAMVEQLGLDVESTQAPFHPESGAYGGGHGHGDHGHSHGHTHGHTHAEAEHDHAGDEG